PDPDPVLGCAFQEVECFAIDLAELRQQAAAQAEAGRGGVRGQVAPPHLPSPHLPSPHLPSPAASFPAFISAWCASISSAVAKPSPSGSWSANRDASPSWAAANSSCDRRPSPSVSICAMPHLPSPHLPSPHLPSPASCSPAVAPSM